MIQLEKLIPKLLILFLTILITTILGLGLIYLILIFGKVEKLTFDDMDQIIINANAHLLKPILAINHLTTFVLSALIYNRYVKMPDGSSYIQLEWKIDMTMLFKCMIFIFCCYPLAALITMLIQNINLPIEIAGLSANNSEVISKLIKSSNLWDLLSSIIVIALIPSIGEELLFRGILQKIFAQHMNEYWAIGLCAFIFAALHLDPLGFGFKFLIGLGLGLVYYLSKNIIIPIVLHFLNNLIPVVILYFSDVKESSIPKNHPYDGLYLGLIALPLAYFSFINIKTHYTNG